MMSKKRTIEISQKENSYRDQIELGHLADTDESLIKDEQDLDISPDDDPFENPPYEPPAPGEGP